MKGIYALALFAQMQAMHISEKNAAISMWKVKEPVEGVASLSAGAFVIAASVVWTVVVGDSVIGASV